MTTPLSKQEKNALMMLVVGSTENSRNPYKFGTRPHQPVRACSAS